MRSRPEAASIAAISVVTVVFPFVPVTPTTGRVREGSPKTVHDSATVVLRRVVPGSCDGVEFIAPGNLVGNPPFSGTVTHRGWRATAVRLPKLSATHDVGVLAPAEVEL